MKKISTGILLEDTLHCLNQAQMVLSPRETTGQM